MTEGVVLIGKTGSLLYANKTARGILSISPEASIAKVESYIEERFRKVYLADGQNNQQDFLRVPGGTSAKWIRISLLRRPAS